MPKYYCEYCDVYMAHEAINIRRQHKRGRKHKDNVRAYYDMFIAKNPQVFDEMFLCTGVRVPPPMIPRSGQPGAAAPMMMGMGQIPLPLVGQMGRPMGQGMPNMQQGNQQWQARGPAGAQGGQSQMGQQWQARGPGGAQGAQMQGQGATPAQLMANLGMNLAGMQGRGFQPFGGNPMQGFPIQQQQQQGAPQGFGGRGPSPMNFPPRGAPYQGAK